MEWSRFGNFDSLTATFGSFRADLDIHVQGDAPLSFGRWRGR